jgi:hypothetical protein
MYFSLLKVTAQKETYIAPKCDMILLEKHNRLCDLLVRVSGYRSRGPTFDSRPYQIF